MSGNSGDIGGQRIAAVYAKALVGASEKTGQTDQVVEELDSLVVDVLEQFPGFEATISSSRLSIDEKMALIDRVFGERASENLRTFLKVLCRHERLDCLRQIRREVHRQHNALRNRVEVEVITAKPLSDPLRSQLVQTLEQRLGSQVSLTMRLDESVIGGLMVRVGDTVVDGSVRNQLARLRTQAVQRVVEQIHEDAGRFADSLSS